MGVVLSAGGSLRWARDELYGAEREAARLMGCDPYELIAAEAEQAPPGAEGLVFLPYLTGERTPYPNPNAKGVFCGLSLRHTKAYLARAVMEGVAFALRDSFEILKTMGVPIGQVRASGGGARSPLWRQIQSDATGFAHSTINSTEGAPYGVALLAGVGTGLWSSVEEACRATIQLVDTCEPNAALRGRYDRLYAVYQKLYAQLEGLFDETAAIVAGT
jgi:xylulokinase